MLRFQFPVSEHEADTFGGIVSEHGVFVKEFSLVEGKEKALQQANEFLFNNGYDAVLSIAALEADETVEGPVQCRIDLPKDKLVITLFRDEMAGNGLEMLTRALIRFRDARDWEQFHNAKDLAIALSIEAGELLEAFLWKEANEAHVEKIREELADVFSFALLLAHKLDMDPTQIVMEKIKKNGEKYPVDKARGKATKYNEL